jgi:nucleoside-diphosphate-sugar epimerase
MQVLFIGGTGIISSACSQLAIERGITLHLFNRGESKRPAPSGAHVIHGDIRNIESARDALAGYAFDAVVDWIGFTPEQVQTDIELFRDRTRQYIFISSASAYQTPPATLPVTEATILDNPYWDYSRAKIACENLLVQAYREFKFPMTIVRPSHTYDRTMLPLHGGYTMVDRMRKGKKVIVPGDGTSLWTLTHHRDFAKGFVGLLGNNHAIGDAFHITSDEILTWNQIYQIIANAAGAQPHIVHVASDYIAAYDHRWGVGLIGDKTHSMIFDNTKIKRVVPDFRATIPFAEGAKEILAWFDADPARRVVNTEFDQTLDKIITSYESTLPNAKRVSAK